jgi:hypothetical protein
LEGMARISVTKALVLWAIGLACWIAIDGAAAIDRAAAAVDGTRRGRAVPCARPRTGSIGVLTLIVAGRICRRGRVARDIRKPI